MGDCLLHLAAVEELGSPKICYLGDTLVIQQYIIRFDVTVDDLGGAAIVQEGVGCVVGVEGMETKGEVAGRAGDVVGGLQAVTGG